MPTGTREMTKLERFTAKDLAYARVLPVLRAILSDTESAVTCAPLYAVLSGCTELRKTPMGGA